MSLPTWDVYCRVVDNYGDVGIAWRLARQLAADGGRVLRLVVDGLDVLARIEPRIDPRLPRQVVAGIEVLAWPESASAADVVVELLGCGLPDAVLDWMAHRDPPTVWVDYEHLSAEDWIDDFHGLPSPHPTRPLVKHFYYPGFGPRSGGLPIESDVDARRRAFVDDRSAVAAFRARLDLPEADRYLSLFAYDDAPVAALLDALAAQRASWTVVVPEGVLDESIAARRDANEASSVATIPFVDQDDYDRLLWSCDVNCVRGEDSFVRAQLAARPFVWAPYRQADGVHLQKLAAFDDRYELGLPVDVELVRRRWSRVWNEAGYRDHRDAVDAATAWLACTDRLHEHAERWSATLRATPVLVERLVAFAEARRRNTGSLRDR